MEDIALYADREATWVKHRILEQYLQKLAYKVGSWSVINYVDGCAGPWRNRSESLADTSPHIAIRELTSAREELSKRKLVPPIFRCLFIEKDPTACEQLKNSLKATASVPTEVLSGDFERHIPDVLRFAGSNFTFFFIDPTGWTGFGMNAIAPLLQHRPGEVLINFMTKDIKRFIDDENSSALPTFVDLFGSADYRQRWKGLVGQDREDKIVETYSQRVKSVGGFTHVVSTIVLHPNDARTHFHLVYATRNREGLRVFRDVEAKVMKEQATVRASAQQAHRTARTGQPSLFGADEPGDERHFEQLRERYLARSQTAVRTTLEARGRISFDELEEVGLAMPMTWGSDIKAWIQEWRQKGWVQIEGLAPKARVPQRDKGHFIVWLNTQRDATC